MASGIVKSFDLSQGFGYITPDDGTEDVRVELLAAEKAGLFTLLEGERVSYVVQQLKDGQFASASKLTENPG